MRIGYLGSGRLGFCVLEEVFEQLKPQFIATDRRSTDLIELARKCSIPLFEGNPRGGALNRFLGALEVDLIFSVNYLFLIEKDILDRVRYVINFHGSLLPRYRGRTPHVWAIINNERLTGVTAHLVDEGCDTGPVVLQRQIEIGEHDTGGDLLNRFSVLYPEMILEILEDLRQDKLSVVPQDETLATYFGKRTPDDGLINWNWQKERIFNWVRAQTAPYPGAFTRMAGQRVIIDRIAYHNGGFCQDEPNGLLKSLSPVLVKTPNGLVELQVIREGRDFLKQGEIFD